MSERWSNLGIIMIDIRGDSGKFGEEFEIGGSWVEFK